MSINRTLFLLAISVFYVAFATGCNGSKRSGKVGALEQQARRIAANLKNFDDLDFNVFTGQKWAELHRSHAHDVIVIWPDGRATNGIDTHIKDLKAMFVWAPDTRIKEHPVRFGQGDWTAVIGVMEGTFSKPMPLPNGKAIPPTGKAFKIRMATIAHWNKNNRIDKEFLFWDNKDFMKQIGLGK